MNVRPWLVALCLAGLAGLPMAGASAPLGTVTATSLEVSSGSTTLGGELRALVEFHSDADVAERSQPMVMPQFQITADRLRVELDIERTSLAVQEVNLNPEPDRHTADYTNAHVQGTQAWLGHELYILPWQGRAPATVDTTPAHGVLSASDRGVIQPWAYASGARKDVPVPSVDATDSHKWVQDDLAGNVCVSGDFVMSLWYWDVLVTATDRKHEYFSGDRYGPPPQPAGPLEAVLFSVNRTQIWLFVEQGDLCAPWFSLHDTSLYLVNEHLGGEGAMSLINPAGELRGESGMQRVAGRKLDLAGALDIQSTGGPDHLLRLDIGGAIDRAALDGKPVSIAAAAVASPAKDAPVWLPWIGAGLLLPTAGGLEAMRRHRLGQRMMRLASEMEAGHYETVLAQAERLVATRAYGKDASVMKALSLIQLGRPQDARRFLDGLSPWTGPQAATQHYLRAYAMALQDDRRGAVQELNACLQKSPDYASEIRANPSFAPMLSDPSLRDRVGLAANSPILKDNVRLLEGYV